ncbi:hypothetical protein A3A09_03420 [Candidatus Nomurabacteria bacterium RIFCSPLOWO2_01_FULL_42_20]|uniref:Uncharacterized protein n=1 Tax=Candidatus Nomurabacteria bacterium RIFCSPHIGHO2_01_FULL_42_16 TaxID=1801743 RepID=A0A1F6VL77_9BACT|nr:MAG: hypothetical protein A2824_02310 [Candidatus Nomurabacteria bacterium RIFCSPHIGHO2_01_FULL_42_16]OGI91309.1 MAG: hypothetical protein A3A09_03420 [Candidatus Nomurabacteria bacterium RIFCSPLOWO2_01_FULL_42_20]
MPNGQLPKQSPRKSFMKQAIEGVKSAFTTLPPSLPKEGYDKLEKKDQDEYYFNPNKGEKGEYVRKKYEI